MVSRSCITFFEKKSQKLDLPAQWKVGSGVAFKVQTLCFASTGVHKYALTACVDGVDCRKSSNRGTSEKYSAILPKSNRISDENDSNQFSL